MSHPWYIWAGGGLVWAAITLGVVCLCKMSSRFERAQDAALAQWQAAQQQAAARVGGRA